MEKSSSVLNDNDSVLSAIKQYSNLIADNNKLVFDLYPIFITIRH